MEIKSNEMYLLKKHMECDDVDMMLYALMHRIVLFVDFQLTLKLISIRKRKGLSLYRKKLELKSK